MSQIRFTVVVLYNGVVRFLFRYIRVYIGLYFPNDRQVKDGQTMRANTQTGQCTSVRAMSVLVVRPKGRYPLALYGNGQRVSFLVKYRVNLFRVKGGLFFYFSLVGRLRQGLHQASANRYAP